jgi:hypothetical protein
LTYRSLRRQKVFWRVVKPVHRPHSSKKPTTASRQVPRRRLLIGQRVSIRILPLVLAAIPTLWHASASPAGRMGSPSWQACRNSDKAALTERISSIGFDLSKSNPDLNKTVGIGLEAVKRNK